MAVAQDATRGATERGAWLEEKSRTQHETGLLTAFLETSWAKNAIPPTSRNSSSEQWFEIFLSSRYHPTASPPSLQKHSKTWTKYNEITYALFWSCIRGGTTSQLENWNSFKNAKGPAPFRVNETDAWCKHRVMHLAVTTITKNEDANRTVLWPGITWYYHVPGLPCTSYATALVDLGAYATWSKRRSCLPDLQWVENVRTYWMELLQPAPHQIGVSKMWYSSTSTCLRRKPMSWASVHLLTFQFRCSGSMEVTIGHSWAPSNHGFKLATLACFIHNHLRQSCAQQPATASHAMQKAVKQIETHASSLIPAFQAQDSAMEGCAATAHGI